MEQVNGVYNSYKTRKVILFVMYLLMLTIGILFMTVIYYPFTTMIMFCSAIVFFAITHIYFHIAIKKQVNNVVRGASAYGMDIRLTEHGCRNCIEVMVLDHVSQMHMANMNMTNAPKTVPQVNVMYDQMSYNSGATNVPLVNSTGNQQNVNTPYFVQPVYQAQ